jgi:XTP/dITP diphosphohydrolase
MSRTLLVASHNRGKIEEYARMLWDLDIKWQDLLDLGVSVEVEESGANFLENAMLKAVAYAAATGMPTLADDSGLEVDALGGAPGVLTARYGGPGLSSEERYKLLLENLRDVPPAARSARFRCAIALAGADNRILASSIGDVEGLIALQPAGAGGFGYDPVFLLPAQGCTMAQLAAEEKHAISHRGKALRAIEPQLRAILSAG